MSKPPRVPDRIAVDPRWGGVCRCETGELWRVYNRAYPDYPQRMCPSCGLSLKEKDA